MRILFLGEPTSPNTISWVEGLREQGCEVYLASVRTDGADGNIPIGNPKLPPRLRILTGVRSLKKVINEIKPDILLAYRITSYGYLAARSGFHPLVLAAQNEQIVYLPQPSFFRRIFLERCVRYAVKNADLMHAWGNNIAKGLMKFGADEYKILTLHRGIDLDKFVFNSTRKFDKKSPIFLSSRSLYPEYQIDKVIDAFALVLKQIPGAKLKIAGHGPEEAILKGKVKELNIEENVKLYGRLNQNQLLELLKSSDIYLSVIETEGLSSSLLESIVCKLLPVVSYMPASKLVVQDKVNGFLIKNRSPENCSVAMIEAVDNYAKIKTALSRNSDFVKENFDRKINQQIFIERYENLIASFSEEKIKQSKAFRRWLLNISYRLSWLSPRITKKINTKGKRILAVWDLCNLPLSVGDLLHAQAYSQALCEYHNANQIDIAVITEAPDNILALRGLNKINFHRYFSVIYPIAFVNKYLGNILLFNNRMDYCRYVAENREIYIVNMPYSNGEINVLRWVDHFKFLKWYFKKSGKRPELNCQISDLLWAGKFIKDKAGEKLAVSVQLRSNVNEPGKNALLVEWYDFFKKCQNKHPEVLFFNLCGYDEIPKGIKGFKNVVNVKDYGSDISQDLALIETCAIHMGSTSGPATMAQFSSKPYAIYSFSGTVEDIPDGISMPWKLATQKLDPFHENSVKLFKDFEELLDHVDIDKWHKEIKQLTIEAEKYIPRRKSDGKIFAAGKESN